MDLVKAAAVVLSAAVVFAVVLRAVCLVKPAVVLSAVCLVKPAVALDVAIPVKTVVEELHAVVSYAHCTCMHMYT